MLKLMLLLVSVVSASIKGPSTFESGQLAVLDGSGSQGDKMQWVVPPQFKSLASKTMKLSLTCDTPGKYVIMLVAVDRDLELAIATHEVTVTGEQNE